MIRRDVAERKGVSAAIWIPTIWAAILLSRPVSWWLGFGGGESSLEGSPADGLGFMVLIFLAIVVVFRRGLNLPSFIVRNWPVFFFYGFLLVSVIWANSPVASFKRWFKELGNIFVLLVILTEENPEEALRAVFVRCAYVLLPMSLILIRYFPNLGRYYSRGGGLEVVGVTLQKNSLGALVVVTGFILLWDLVIVYTDRRGEPRRKRRYDLGVRAVVLIMGVWLLMLSNSKTSLLCLMLGSGMLIAGRLPFFRFRLGTLGALVIGGLVGFFVLDQLLGIKEFVVSSLGRDMTFTGRTDVWRVLLGLNTDPIFGTGFMSFWDDKEYQAKLPNWIAHSAHNGYLEIYLAGGILGLTALGVMLLGLGGRLVSGLSGGGDYAVMRFAIFLMLLIANFSESNFACMTPEGFLFLIAAIGYAGNHWVPQTSKAPALADPLDDFDDAEMDDGDPAVS
jgi:exopolysaccharide production protein ExoQ